MTLPLTVRASEQFNELAAALAKAQGTMTNATMNRINPHFKSKYADLASVLDASRKPLSDNGLSVVQTIGGNLLTTLLLHSSGQWISSEYPLPAMARPQEMGSALTYARRYSLSAIIGISADEDDDGNAGNKRENPHVNRPSDFVDVPPPDDPNSIPSNPDIKPLPKKDARADNNKLQQEMNAITDPEKLQAWGLANKDRVASQPLDWQDIFRGHYRNHMIALRSALIESTLTDLDNAYENCEGASDFFDVDEKMYQPLLPKLSTEDQGRAGKIRERHMARFAEP